MDRYPGIERPRLNLTRLMIGVLLVGAGVVLTLDNLGLIAWDPRELFRYWPAVFILVGIANLLQGCSWLGGLVWIGVGSVLLAGRLGWLTVELRDLMPLGVALIGLLVIRRALWGRRRPRSDRFAELNAAAVLGGVQRASTSQDFHGGTITAVLGGCDIDLRQASIGSEAAVLDVLAIWGGIEIKVPEDWTVDGRVTPLLGGFEDKTRPPANATKHLVVRGTVIMGGVEVKN